MRGQPEHSEDLGGVSHLRDGERHAYVYDHGGAAYHDVDHLGSESPMRPLGEAWLRQDAGERLASLGLPGGGPVKLVPAKLGAQQASRMDASGKPVETWLTGQSVSFVQTIDNLPVFGAGAQVQIDYVDGGVVAGFSHGLRRLESAGTVATDSPEAAIQRYAARAESQNRWNLYRSYIYKVDRLEIEEAELGYYLPDAGTPVETVEPVYALRGLAHGYDHRGRPAVVQVLWLEPASVGREIPSLFISAEASR